MGEEREKLWCNIWTGEDGERRLRERRRRWSWRPSPAPERVRGFPARERRELCVGIEERVLRSVASLLGEEEEEEGLSDCEGD